MDAQTLRVSPLAGPALAAVLLPLAVLHSDAAPEDLRAEDLARIALQYCELDYQSMGADGTLQPAPIWWGNVDRYVAQLTPKGTWPDVDYNSQGRSWWDPIKHTDRLAIFGRAYRAKKDPAVEEAFHRALAYWMKAGHKGPNWWSNEIGAPNPFSNACLLMDDCLSDEERAAAVAYLRSSAKAPEAYSGQNRVWVADIAFRRDLLARDLDGVRKLHEVIGSEIRIGDGPEGLRSDGCFHQHGAQPQFGNYGLSFLAKASLFAQAFNGTPLAWTEEQYEALRLLLGDGYRWILWKGRFDPAHIGRQRFPNASVNKAHSVMQSAVRLAETGRPEFVALRDALLAENLGAGAATAFTGYKFFRDSAFSVYRTPEWMASVKMHTPDVIGTEIVNEEDCFGGHVADGALFTSVTGREYDDVYPLWNWRLIPGITSLDGVPPSAEGPKKRNASHFVHGASEGEVGVTAMTCNREGLVSHKTWIFTPEFILCLGAGIASARPEPVVTSVEQSLRNGAVKMLEKGTWREVNGREAFHADEVRAMHAGSGYIVRTPKAEVSIAAEPRHGDFHDFMHPSKSIPKDGDVFEIALHHGVAPKGATYEYWVLPRTDETALAAFDCAAKVRVVRNDAEEQIVDLAGYRIRCRIVRGGDNPGVFLERK